MKIYINRQPVTGPWGGGNKTVTLLHEKCKKEFEITDNINDPDIASRHRVAYDVNGHNQRGGGGAVIQIGMLIIFTQMHPSSWKQCRNGLSTLRSTDLSSVVSKWPTWMVSRVANHPNPSHPHDFSAV